MFANLFLLHDEEIEDMALDMKESVQAFNPKLGKQRAQHYDAVKLGHVWCLNTKLNFLDRQNSFKSK